jgi:restriction system protein
VGAVLIAALIFSTVDRRYSPFVALWAFVALFIRDVWLSLLAAGGAALAVFTIALLAASRSSSTSASDSRDTGHFAPARIDAVDQFLALTPAEFEEAIARLLRERGYRDVRRVGGPGDVGVDVLCRDPMGLPVAVQCKRYGLGTPVRSRDIQGFLGVMRHHRAAAGIVVTTSTFTQNARALAEAHSLRLIDRPELSGLIDDHVRNPPSLPG